MGSCVYDSSNTAVWQTEMMELPLSGIGKTQAQHG